MMPLPIIILYLKLFPPLMIIRVSCDSRKQTFKVVSGRKDSAKHASSSAGEACSMWSHVNKPKNGPYFVHFLSIVFITLNDVNADVGKY